MDDELAALLSPDTRRIAELIHQKNFSMEELRAAHPEITPEQIIKASVELMGVIEELAAATADESAPARMPKKGKSKKSPSGDAFQLKITLRGSKPPIWRRVVVPVEIRLDVLHEVIQRAMGWYNCHLHLFEIGGEVFQGRGPDGYWDDDMDALDEADYHLCDVVAGEKTKFRYEYDFGDGWEHTLLVEKVVPSLDRPQMMTCLAGKNRCPMEDSGGLWGYYDKLRIIGDPKDPEHEEIKEWMGEIDPSEFDLDAVNRDLARLK